MDLDKIEERSQIGPRRRNDLPQGASGSELPCRPGPSACRTSPPRRGDDKCGHRNSRAGPVADWPGRERDAAVVIAERRREGAAPATASRHQERLAPPSLSDRWCVQRGDLRRNARQRARRAGSGLSHDPDQAAVFDSMRQFGVPFAALPAIPKACRDHAPWRPRGAATGIYGNPVSNRPATGVPPHQLGRYRRQPGSAS